MQVAAKRLSESGSEPASGARLRVIAELQEDGQWKIAFPKFDLESPLTIPAFRRLLRALKLKMIHYRAKGIVAQARS
jgi:hypothetical protein